MENPKNTPVVSQPSPYPTSNEKIGFQKKYLLSIFAAVRICIIVFQFGGFISAAAVPVNDFTDSAIPTRDAFIAFSITGFILSAVLFILYLFNIVAQKFISKLPWPIMIFFGSLVFGAAMTILAIVCAVKDNAIDRRFSKGALTAASVFGFLSALSYSANAFLHLKKQIRK